MAEFHRDRSEISISIVDQKGHVFEEDLPNIYQPIEEAVDRLLPGIQFESIERQDDEYKIQFRNRTGEIVTFDQMSSGERDVLAIVFSFLGSILSNRIAEAKDELVDSDNIVILMDDPEAYMHPQLQLKFLNYITRHLETENEYGIDIQVIMVGHSKVIIDNIPRDSLYYLFFSDQIEGNNQLKRASDLPSELEDIISEEIGLSVLASGEDLLLVEGSTDREILIRIDEDIEKSTTIVPIGGKKSILGLDKAFNKLIPELRQSNIHLYAIVDRDRDLSLDNQISSNIHPLPVTMIENLVLKPGPLFSTIEHVLGDELDRTEWSGPDDIKTLLEQIVRDSDFIERESQLRWNEDFNPLNVDYKGYQRSTGFATIEDFAKNCVANRLNEVDDFSDIHREVEGFAQRKEFGELHGKYILAQVSNEFNIEQGRLLRMTADRISLDDLPQETKQYLQSIKQ